MINKWTVVVCIAALAIIAGIGRSAVAQEYPTEVDAVPANLAAPPDAVLLFKLHARGVQIYTCDVNPEDASAYAWIFTAPEAELFNQRDELVGNHFAGPTWEGLDGSSVVGKALERADAPETGAIPWLLLQATEHSGTGAFSTISYVQRLETTGGVAPAEGCDADHAGDVTREPYEATYAFYYPTAPATPVADASSY